MKKINLILTSFCLLLGYSAKSQKNHSETHYKHSLSYFYPNYHHYDSKFRISLPLINSGIKYNRYFEKNKIGFQTSLFSDWLPMSSRTIATEFGETVNREVFYLSFGAFKPFFLWDNLRLNISADLSGRFGVIGWLAAQNAVSSTFQGTPLIDAGASIGTELNYVFNKFFIALELKHSFYFFLYEDGKDVLNLPTASRNVSIGSLGCGFFFGK